MALEMAYADSVYLNRYVQGTTNEMEFGKEFPSWMWNNQVTREFLTVNISICEISFSFSFCDGVSFFGSGAESRRR